MTTINKMKTFYKKKQDMFDAVGYDKPYYFSKDISTDGAFKEFFYCDDINDVKEILEIDNNIYEIIAENKQRYSYFDFDGTYQSFQKHITDDMYVDDFILREFKVMLEEFKERYGFEENIDNLVVLQGTKPNKISFHIIDNSISLKNCYECNLYHKKFIEYLIEKDNCLLDLLDKGVYDKDRNFRCINQSKKTKIPYPLKSKAEISDTLVCCNSKDILNIPPAWKISKDKIVKQPEKVVIDNAEIDLLLKHINDERWIDYKLWIETVWCLMALKVDIDTIHQKSDEIGIDKYNKNDLDSVIKQFDPTKKWSMNTLRKWAEEDTGFVVETVFEKPAPVLDENKKNHITCIDIQRKYNKKIFIDMIGVDEFCYEVSQAFAYIQVGDQDVFAIYVNRKEQHKIVNRLNKIKIAFVFSNQKEKVKYITLQEFMIDNPAKFPIYTSIVCKPCDYELEEHEYNIWSGFKATKVDVIDMDIVNLYLKHIYEVWCCCDETQYRYVLSWWAQIIQMPYKKTETVIVLLGEQGGGKGMPVDIMIEYVFGNEISLATSGINRITGNFNNSLKGKILTKVDEISNINGGNENFHAVFDRLKDIITGKSFECEQKGKDPFQITNNNNFIFTSNNFNCLKVEETDRRLNIMVVDDKYLGNYEYFKNFSKVCCNQNAGNHIFTYFLQYTDIVNLRKIPMTEMKKQMIQNSKPNPLLFLEDYEIKSDIEVNSKKISNEKIYLEYCNWCSKEGEKIYAKKTFLNNIKKFIKTTGNSKNNVGKQARWIQL